ncbi:uncharacterized protein [Diadema setosum]|uniref:uncharacterized protein n=1 Tax=Diadema setosum TaxID=31175 RepID=UPI003B3B4984
MATSVTSAENVPVVTEQTSVKSVKVASAAGSRRSVKSEKLVDAFNAEMEVMDQEEELARIKAEHEYAQKMQAAERKLRKLKLIKEHKERLAQLEEEDDLSHSGDADIQLPEESKSESIQRFLDSQEEKKDPAATPIPRVETMVKKPTDVNRGSTPCGLQRVAESLVEVAKSIGMQNASAQQVAMTSQLPGIDLPVFSGDPLLYPLWRNAFGSLVDSKPLPLSMKLHFLSKSVAGTPKRAVERYLLLGTEDAYERACATLAERYGSPSVVSSAFLEKLNTWPRVGDRDATGLSNFSDFLDQVGAAKLTIPTLNILDFPQENVKLLEKLPSYLERQWREEIIRWRGRGYGDYPPFARFADFVRNAACKANIPELESLKRESRFKQATFGQSQTKSSGRTMMTSGSKVSQHGEYSSCPFCKKEHYLDECQDFKKREYSDRKKFFFERRLCMGCGMDDRHRVKDCPQRKTCQVCKGSHLTSLHRPDQLPKEKVSSNCISVCHLPDQEGKDHAMIVPVWVRHADDPGREFLQYAILDDQSNVGFITRELCDKMGVKGPETDLQLTTMQSTSIVKTTRVSGVQVLDFNRDQVIDLPPLYTRDAVPASRSQIPKSEVVKHWPHLESVAHKLMPYNKNVKVSLLIGNDCPRAIRPREVLAGGDDDPYALRTSLGWGVVGRVCQTPSQKDDVVCNRILAKEILNPNPADDASRGLSSKELTTDDRWLKGPEFLWRDGVFHGEPVESVQVNNNDPEVKVAATMTTAASEKCRAFPDHFETCRLTSVSSWHRAKKAVARSFQLKSTLRKQAQEMSPKPAEMNQTEVQEYLLQNGCDWVPFVINVPHAFHMGGVWERQIRTVRRVLEPLLKSLGSQTFMTEAEAIVNSRPLTTGNLSDHGAPEPLTPNHILTMKARIALPPPGVFQREDSYARKWWRRFQYAANEFWARWKKKYLQELKSRQKWVRAERNLAVGDIVIAKEGNEARCWWPLARVINAYPSKNGCVRKVKILMADRSLDNEGKRQRQPTELDRPVSKLVLLLPAEDK